MGQWHFVNMVGVYIEKLESSAQAVFIQLTILRLQEGFNAQSETPVWFLALLHSTQSKSMDMYAYTSSDLKPTLTHIPFIGNTIICNRLYISIFWKYRELSLALIQALGTRTEVHGSINFVANDGLGLGGGALYVISMAQLQLFQGANLTFEGNTGVWVKVYVWQWYLEKLQFNTRSTQCKQFCVVKDPQWSMFGECD